MTRLARDPKFVYPLLFLLAALNIFFALNHYINGDLLFHYVLINCFSEQFWQGDFYPRWCFNGNAQMGTLQPLFYFPLPYFIAALFYPLTQHGFTLAEVFFLMCFLATFITAIASYQWLKDFVSPETALLIAGLFLFLPYRMELLTYRVAYAELWFVAWLPFVLKYTRRIALGGGFGNVVMLALMVGLAALSHTLCTLIALMFSGTYLVLMTDLKMPPKYYFGIAVLWGVLLACFFILPSLYYQQHSGSQSGWANRFITWRNLCKGQTRPVISRFMMTTYLVTFAFYLLAERGRIKDALIRREVLVWIAIGGTATLLLSSYTKPLYELFGGLSKMIFPWRMQMIADLAVVFMGAVFVNWFFVSVNKYIRKIAYVGALLIFLFMDTYLSDIKFHDKEMADNIMNSYAVRVPEYRPKWVDRSTWSFEAVFEQHKKLDSLPKVEIIKGKGKAEPIRWGWDGMEVKTEAKKDIAIVLSHYYFPIWKARLDNETDIALYPQKKTGKMQLDIPAGEHNILLTYSIFNGFQNLVYSYWVSLLAFIGLLAAMAWHFRRRNTT